MFLVNTISMIKHTMIIVCANNPHDISFFKLENSLRIGDLNPSIKNANRILNAYGNVVIAASPMIFLLIWLSLNHIPSVETRKKKTDPLEKLIIPMQAIFLILGFAVYICHIH